MLNGRVYGSRRASEAAERQKEYQAKLEPDFVEWGNGKQGGLGSNAPTTSRGFLGDDDDGSGMEWVKRRREERLKKQQAEKEAAEANQARSAGVVFNEPNLSGISPAASMSTNSPETNGSLITPATSTSPLPPTPIIQVSEPSSPSANRALESGGFLGKSAPGKLQGLEPEHVTQAISVPQRSVEGRDVFDDTAVSDDDGADEEEEDGEEEEEDDGDFDDDDEEEDEGPRWVELESRVDKADPQDDELGGRRRSCQSAQEHMNPKAWHGWHVLRSGVHQWSKRCTCAPPSRLFFCHITIGCPYSGCL
jgi:hypothetical protein